MTRDEITGETAERHEQRLLELRRLLASEAAVRVLLIVRIHLHMQNPVPRRYTEPELEISDAAGRWRASITVDRKEFRVTLPGGTVHIKEARQAALLAGTP